MRDDPYYSQDDPTEPIRHPSSPQQQNPQGKMILGDFKIISNRRQDDPIKIQHSIQRSLNSIRNTQNPRSNRQPINTHNHNLKRIMGNLAIQAMHQHNHSIITSKILGVHL